MPSLDETLPPSCLAPVDCEYEVELLAEAVPIVAVPIRLVISSAVS